MRFKVDENLPTEAAELLRVAKHDAETVLDEQLGGAPDGKIADVCKSERRVLLTLDLDFADIRTYPPSQFSGIIILRLDKQDKASVLTAVTSLLPELAMESPDAKIWVVDDRQIRIRGD